jgi:SAM-dependent methyltransferase
MWDFEVTTGRTVGTSTMKTRKNPVSKIIHFLCLTALFSCLIVAETYKSVASLPQDSLSYRDAIEKTLDLAGMKAGMIIGEVGAGYGFFTRHLSERVTGSGRIYANDIDQEALDILTEKGLPNVGIVLGTSDDPLFPVKNLDMIIMRSVFHDLENPLAMLENLKAYLKPDASLVVVGPRPAEENADAPLPIHNMTREEMIYIVDQSSFALESTMLIPSWWGVYVFKVEKEREKDVWPDWQDGFDAAVQEALQFEKDSDVSHVKKRIAWERVSNSYRDNDPQSTEDEKRRDFIRQRISALDEQTKRSVLRAGDVKPGVPKTSESLPDLALRSDYRSLGMNDIEMALEKLGFKAKAKLRAESGDFPNRYESGSLDDDMIVVDRASGLMWLQGGSAAAMDYFEAQEWIDDLNIRNYAGYSDWRLPSVEEAASLMETKAMNGDLFIDPVFSQIQRVIWTGDPYYGGRIWLALFYRSSFADDLKVHIGWVRPVR